MPLPRRLPARTLLLFACACALASASVSPVGAAEPTTADGAEVTSYIPATASQDEIEAATPAQQFLSGSSKDFPAICEDLSTVRREDAGAVGDEDRVDIGAPAIELEGVEDGRSYSYCFFVHNRSRTPLDFRLSATELVGSSDPNQKQELIRPPVSVGTWIHPAITEFTLEPGERIYIPYEIDIPEGAPGGTSAGALEIVRLDNPAGGSGGGAGFSITMLHKVFITLPGGEAKPLKVTNISAPRLLARSQGETSYVARFNVKNEGTIVESYDSTLEMRGLGLRVASTTSPTSILLPQGAERTRVRIADMPWIGIYRPKVLVDGRAGEVEVQLPWLLVLPPWPYVAALLVAILLPIIAAVRRWLERRAEWQAYLDEEDDDVWEDDADAQHW